MGYRKRMKSISVTFSTYPVTIISRVTVLSSGRTYLLQKITIRNSDDTDKRDPKDV